jgi:hypothetical protein
MIPNTNTVKVAFSGSKPTASRWSGDEEVAEIKPNARKKKLATRWNT